MKVADPRSITRGVWQGRPDPRRRPSGRLAEGVGVLLLIFLAGASGCTRAKPKVDPVQLDVEVPERWRAGSGPAGPVQEAWWRTFGDPGLEEVVAEALEGNRDLRVAAARLEAAAAEARIIRAELYPTLGLGYDATRRRQNFIGLPIPGAEERVLSTTFTSMGISLDTAWEADLWDRISAGEVAALARLDAVEADLRAARLSLAAQTARSWFSVVEARRQAQLAEDIVKSYALTLERVRVRFERGLRPSLDLRLARSNLAAAEARLRQRRQLEERAVRQLELLLGRYPEGTLRASGGLPEVPPPVPAGLPPELVARRPDLQAAERRLRASEAGIVQSQASLLPRLSLTGSGGTATRSLRDLLNGDFGVWSLAGGLLQPIFQGGRLRAGVERSEAQSREALAAYAAAVLRALAEVETALSVEEELGAEEVHLRQAAQEARAALELAENRYRSGLEEIVTVLEAQRRVLETEVSLLSVRRQRLEARVDLHRSLGGGF